MTNEDFVEAVKKGKLLSNEEFVQAIKKGKREPIEAWGRFYKLIKSVAVRYSDAPLEDLMQEAYFAILDAIRCYDGSVMFTTYLVYWLKQRFLRYSDNCCRSVRVPVSAAARARKYRRMLSDFERMAGREPTTREVETALHCDVDTLRRDLIALTSASLDKSLNEDEGGTLAELLPDDVDIESSVINELNDQELTTKLWELVDMIPEADTIRKRYQEGKTANQCADEMHTTPAKVRRDEARAIRRLRSREIINQLEPYLDDYRYSKGLKGGHDPTARAAMQASAYLEKLKTDGLI